MTTNLLRGKSGETMTSGATGLAIGETDAHVFSCPSCARPLADGTSRCPGCHARLVMGVRVKRAGAILALGIVIGAFVGGAATASIISLSLVRAAPAVAVEASAAPVSVAAAAAKAAPSVPPVVVESGAPAAAVSALSGTAVVNGRIALDAATLKTTLTRAGASTIEIARALRSLAADATLGVDLTGRLGSWTDGAAVMAKLDGFYRAMANTARDAFRASLTDEAAYRTAGAAMVTVLAALGDVDAVSRTLATTVDLELPPVALSVARGTAAPLASTVP